MRIKHWQGYGCVTANKIYDEGRMKVVEVHGDHECGLIRRDDNYTIEKWLGRFFKGRVLDYYVIDDTGIKDYGNGSEEYARYVLFTKGA